MLKTIYISFNNVNTKSSNFITFITFLIIALIILILWNLTSEPTKYDPPPRRYYMAGGGIYPKPANISKTLGYRDAKILPFEDPDSDRFENQLMFIPPNYPETRDPKKNKLILLPDKYEGWWYIGEFKDRKCPVDTCTFSRNRNDIEKADFIMFSRETITNATWTLTRKRTPNQIYAFYRLESPIHYPEKFPKSLIYNWTVTYRHDSDVPIPYYKWVYYDPEVKQKPQYQNFAKNKTKKVAWMVSNCEAGNDRQAYVESLRKYIDVDAYGKCGTLTCKRDFGFETACLSMLSKHYKFYLSFENSNCADYMSEKIFRNALQHSMIPIVMGARKKDYERQLPYKSFISVEDFASPKELAEYLNKVDRDDDLYNSYFQWRGTGELLDNFKHLWCRICAMLHDEFTMKPRWYDDMNKWWFDPETMRRGLWRDTQD